MDSPKMILINETWIAKYGPNKNFSQSGQLNELSEWENY